MSETGLPQSEIRTRRLRLRPLQPADAGLIGLYAIDPRVARMTAAVPHPYPPGLAEAFVSRALTPGAAETVWALDMGEDGENGLIGLIGLKRKGSEAEIGYWVAPAFWNAGYAGEAVEGIAGHAAACGIRALTAQVFRDNLASARVLARAGFVQAGTGETHSLARGGMVPTFRYRRELR
jgi:RimJ/RimL family protein N-acetyltransferase